MGRATECGSDTGIAARGRQTADTRMGTGLGCRGRDRSVEGKQNHRRLV